MSKKRSNIFYNVWLTLLFNLILFSCTSQKYGYLKKIPVHTENKIVQRIKLTGNKILNQPDSDSTCTNGEIILASSDKKETVKIMAEQSYLSKIKPVHEYSLAEQKSYSISKGKFEKNSKKDTPIVPKEEIHKPAFVAFVFAMIGFLGWVFFLLLLTSFGQVPPFIYHVLTFIVLICFFLTVAAVLMGIIILIETIKLEKRGKGFAIGAILLGMIMFLAWLFLFLGFSGV